MKTLKEFILESKENINYIYQIVVNTGDKYLKDFFWKECNISQESSSDHNGKERETYYIRSREKYLDVIEKIAEYLPKNYHSFQIYIQCNGKTHKKLINNVVNKYHVYTNDNEVHQYDFKNDIYYECLDFRKYNKEIMDAIIACLG